MDQNHLNRMKELQQQLVALSIHHTDSNHSMCVEKQDESYEYVFNVPVNL